MPQFIVVRLVDFHAAAERRLAPGLAGHPLVIGGARDGRGTVVATSLEARALGVREGQPLREAAALAPRALFLPGRLDRALDLACEVDESLRRLTPHVAWSSIDEATLEVHEGHTDPIVEALSSVCRERFGLTVAVGVAGAQIAARVAARLAGQRGLIHVLPGYERRFLGGLDVAWLDGVSPTMLERLRAHQLHTFRDVAGLAAPELLRVIGREGPVLARLAAGDDDRRVSPMARPRRLCRTVSSDRLNVEATPVLIALEAQVEALTARLAQFGCGTRSVSLRVEYDDGEGAQRSVPLSAPATDAVPLVVAVRALVAHLKLEARPWRCATVSLGALSAVPQQLSLFGATPAAQRGGRHRTRAGFAALAALPYLQRRRA